MSQVSKKKWTMTASTTSIVLILVSLVAVNVIFSNFNFRADITEDQLYSLTDGTKKLLGKVKEPTTLKYYYTKGAEGIPLNLKNYGNKIAELLQEYVNQSEDVLNIEIYDPKPDSDEEAWAEKYGLNGIDVGNGEKLFMGLVVVQAEKELKIPFFDPRREQFLEYDISQLFFNLGVEQEKVVGILAGLPVMGAPGPPRPNAPPKWAMIRELEKNYTVREISNTADDIDDDISLLVVVHPKGFSEKLEYAIDQFVMRGGELVLLVDPNARVDPGGQGQMAQFGPKNSDLPKILKHWGVSYDSNKVLGDLERATSINSQSGEVNYFLVHDMKKDAFNSEVIATQGLENMVVIEPGAFELTEKSPLKLTPLITSSQQSGLVNGMEVRIGQPAQVNKKVKAEGKNYTLSGILTGEITSAFDKRPEGAEGDEPKDGLKPHLSSSQENANVLLMTDVDFIADQFSVQQMNLLGQIIIQPINDNLGFLLNMIESLEGSEEMMEIRSRGTFSRPFTTLLTMKNQAQAKYQAEEEKLSASLAEVQQRLQQLRVNDDNEVLLTKDQIQRIETFREEERQNKAKLREIRKLLREDIELQKTWLIILNLTVVPFVMICLGAILYWRRMNRKIAK